MTPKFITSRTNPAVKEAARLLTPGGRKKTGRFLLEGARLCADAAANGFPLKRVFVTEHAREQYAREYDLCANAAEETCLIDPSVAEKLSDVGSTQGFFAVAEKREAIFTLDPDGLYVLTDRVQNPDNLGALSRTAEALGAAGLILAGGCDLYTPKALRASMGALLRLPVLQTDDAPGFLHGCRERGMRAVAAVLDPAAVDIRALSLPGGRVLVIGNEGAGVSDEVKAACTDLALIPMPGRAESLNAAAAAAILIWELQRGRIEPVNHE
jgi:TrmH family RNA methyltransferase